MRGIIYKDVCLFFRCIDKRVLLVMMALGALFIVKGGAYAGILLSILLGMLVGAANVSVFEKEQKVEWEKYQRALPVGCGKVVAGKYAAVLLTTLLGAVGAAICNLAAFAAYGRFELAELGFSVLLAALIPVAWTAVSLPFCYWCGVQIAQFASMPLAFLLFFSVKNFEDGMWAMPDVMSLGGGLYGYLSLGLLAMGGMFLCSLAVSVAGYCRRK